MTKKIQEACNLSMQVTNSNSFFTEVKFAKCQHRRLAVPVRRYFTLVLGLVAFLGALVTIAQQGELFTNVAVANQGPPEEQPRQGPTARKPQVGDSPNPHNEQQGQSKA
ncbi:hypothetical protein V8E52_007342 [Russula decolorans]